MSKEVKIIAWCDGLDHAVVGSVPATGEHVITMDDNKAKILDLCDVCEKELIEPLRQLLAFAADAKKTTKKATSSSSTSYRVNPGPTQCPLCPTIPKSRGALGQHLKVRHDTTFTELKEQGTEVVESTAPWPDE